MELDLSRVEYLQAGLTSGRTLRLLPGPGLLFQNTNNVFNFGLGVCFSMSPSARFVGVISASVS